VTTLQAVYELPRRGVVTQHAGTFAGYDCITTLYHLEGGGVVAAYRVVGQNLYALERLGARPAETLAWRDGEARSRELRIGAEGAVVGLTARGEWPDAHAVHLFVLDGGRIGPVERERFLATGTFYVVGDVAGEAGGADVVCHCIHVTGHVLRAAIDRGGVTFRRLQEVTGCGTVCGGCVPAVAEMLGAEQWVVADVVAERDETPDIRSFELVPRHGPFPGAQPGQHVVVEGLVKGLRVRRPYTLSAAPGEGGRVRITVKRETGGAFSPWLFDERPKGQPLRVTRPRGDYVVDLSAGRVVCLVAGIGVTPAVAAARTAVTTERPGALLVHYSGRSRDRMACLEELESLAGPSVELMVRETAREGRLGAGDVARLVDRCPGAEWYLCGPPGYLDEVGQLLRMAGVDPRRVHVEAFTPVGTRSPATREGLDALTRYLVRPPVPSPPRPLARALRRAGTVLVSLANGSLTDWRLGPVQLNPLRWLESRLGRAAGLDPAVPHEQLALISGLSWGPFEFQVRAFDRLTALGAANRERARRPRSPGPPIASDTPDGDTFTCWAPAVPFPRFPAEVAVDTGWTRFGPGRLVPLYVTRSRIALESLLRRGDEVERSPIPYHFVQQVTGRIDVPSCPGRKASGLIAGQFHDNATWAEDRALATDMFGFPVIEGFGPGVAAALDEVCAAVDAALARDPDAVVDLDVLLSGVAHTMIIRAVFGNVDLAEMHALGRDLSEPVGRLLAYAHDFVMGRHSIPADYTEAQHKARAAGRRLVDLLRELDRDGRLSDAQRAVPSVRLILEMGREPDGAYERLYALFVPLIIGGHETTGHTLSWTFYEMARQPRIEHTVLAEIREFRAVHGGRPLTTADYDERPVSWALLAEVLRRHPPVQSVARTTPRDGVVPPDPDTGIGGFRYPSGAVIAVSILGVHLDPRRWPDPYAFRLERWFEGVREEMSLTEKGQAVRGAIRLREQSLDWLAFADGRGRCPGQHLMRHEFLLVLDALLPRYRFELVSPEREVGSSEAMVVGPERGRMAVRIRPRRGSPI
jgi:ferredoxin-NADP reductase/cytochrome P450